MGMERAGAAAVLEERRGGIAGRADASEDRLRQARIELTHVDRTILRSDPDPYDVEAKPVSPCHHAFAGQVTRAILDMPRISPSPVDDAAITKWPMEEREPDLADKRLVEPIRRPADAGQG